MYNNQGSIYLLSPVPMSWGPINVWLVAPWTYNPGKYWSDPHPSTRRLLHPNVGLLHVILPIKDGQ